MPPFIEWYFVAGAILIIIAIGFMIHSFWIKDFSKSGKKNDQVRTKSGKKNDQDLYDKVDYSLVPIEILTDYFEYATSPNIKLNPDYKMFVIIHDVMNKRQPYYKLNETLEILTNIHGVKPLSSALGYGISKYGERDNWKKFDSSPERFLKAALRHLVAIMEGYDYDNEDVKGYPMGLDHRGAVCFNLMVAINLLKKSREVK